MSWWLGLGLLVGPSLGLMGLVGVDRAGAVLLIWIALAGLPCGTRSLKRTGGSDPALGADLGPATGPKATGPNSNSVVPPGWSRLCTELALALAYMSPLLCLASALDLAAGVPAAALTRAVPCGAALALLLQGASNRAQVSAVGQGRYAWLWLCGVVVLPALMATAHWGLPSDAQDASGWAGWVRVSPLQWAFVFAREQGFEWPTLAFAFAGLLWLVSPAPEHNDLSGGHEPSPGAVA